MATTNGLRRSATNSLIPRQPSRLARLSKEAAHYGPLARMCRDLMVFTSMLPLLPGVFLPLKATESADELYLKQPNLHGILTIAFVTILEVVLMILAIPAFIVLPGGAFILITALGIGLIYLICEPIQGPVDAIPSKKVLKTLTKAFPQERWLFLNGCAVSGHALQENIDRLTVTFGRPVRGIHNRTYGLIGDLIECIIQRSIGFYTKETRYSYEYVKAYCCDPTVKKVVLIAHSQGGIMASNILDQLFTEISAEDAGKLEVYTFGNAAEHFSNPLKGRSGSISGHSKRIISHIEHYANSEDMVTRWGVLYSIKNLLDNRFCGQVFVHQGASGHMLNQHYLGTMFPLRGEEPTPGEGVDKVPFLDQKVAVDKDIERRRCAEADKQRGIMRHESLPIGADVDKSIRVASPVRTGSGSLLTEIDGRVNIVGGPGMEPEHSDSDSDSGHEDNGKTVKELSRLWKYLKGGDPDQEI